MSRLFVAAVFVALSFAALSPVFLSAQPWAGGAFSDQSDGRTDWDRFSGTARTRFGVVPVDRIPDRIESTHPRYNPGFRFGDHGAFLGIDPEVRSSRFFTPPEISAIDASEYLGLPQRRPDDRESANTLAPAARADTSVAIRRPTNFFQRPGLMEPPSVVSEEDLNRLPVEQRWFRDIGRRPTLANLPGNPLGPGAPGSGEAFAVGGEILTAPGTAAAGPITDSAPVVHPAQARRQFEQALESQLLAAPSVHLLSPVQVSIQDGVVTVRGIVASQADKVAVGTVLLGNPAVKQVNNLITVIPRDPGDNPAPIDVKP